MSVIHTGQTPAKLKEFMNPYDSDTFYVVWEEKLGNPTPETILTSEWITPEAFEVGDTQTDISITDSKGNQYNNANSAVISCDTSNITPGRYKIYNQITTATRTIRRGFEIEVREI